MVLGTVSCQYVRVGRIGNRFPGTQYEPHSYQSEKAVYKSCGHGRARPDKEPGRENPINIQVIREPARNEHERSVRPEKRREQNTDLRGGESKLVFINTGETSSSRNCDARELNPQLLRKPNAFQRS